MNTQTHEWRIAYIVESSTGDEKEFNSPELYETIEGALAVVKYGLESGDVNDAFSIQRVRSRDLSAEEIAQYKAELLDCTKITKTGVRSMPDQDYPIYSVIGLSPSTGETELIINDDEFIRGDVFHTDDIDEAFAKHEEFALKFPKAMITNNSVILNEHTQYRMKKLKGVLDQTSLPDEFCEAMHKYERMVEANGGEDTEESIEQFMVARSLAPDWFNDMAFNKAQELGLLPTATHCTEDGVPVFKLEEIAQHLGISTDDAIAGIEKMQAARKKHGLDELPEIPDQPIHKLQ